MDYQFKISTPSGELRRLRFKHEPTWREFKESLTSFIPGRSWEDFVVQYRDEEGDQIIVNTQPEWSEALAILAEDKIKKFSIISKVTKSACSSSSSSSFLTQDLNRENIEATLRQVLDQLLVSADSVVSQIPDLVDTFVEEIKKYQPTPVDTKPVPSSSTQPEQKEEESKQQEEEPLRFTPNVESSFLGELRAPSCRRFSPIHSRGSPPIFRRAYPSSHCEYSRLHDAGFRFLQEKNYPSALESFQELVRRYPGNSIARYNLACTYSLLSTTKDDEEKEAAQQSALEALRQAIQIGYSNLQHMERDEDLDPIRQRLEYLRLVSELKGVPFEEPSSPVIETPIIEPTVVEPIFVIPTFEPIQEEITKVQEPVPEPQPIPQPSTDSSELDSNSRYSEEIKQLLDMGFFDAKRNLELLVRNDGDIFRVIAQLLD